MGLQRTRLTAWLLTGVALATPLAGLAVWLWLITRTRLSSIAIGALLLPLWLVCYLVGSTAHAAAGRRRRSSP